VDGFSKCEKWIRDDIVDTKESKTTSWLKRFIGRAKKPAMTWPFPFVEEKLFVFTTQAGVEGFHIYAGGRHVTSFPYRPVCSLCLFVCTSVSSVLYIIHKHLGVPGDLFRGSLLKMQQDYLLRVTWMSILCMPLLFLCLIPVCLFNMSLRCQKSGGLARYQQNLSPFSLGYYLHRIISPSAWL
jgi:hypothetical protein